MQGYKEKRKSNGYLYCLSKAQAETRLGKIITLEAAA
jgi:hypothetical protein